MKNYIFITYEGYTYQPNTDSVEPDIENCQVIGFTRGSNEKEAFENLIKENDYLLSTTFNEIICIELKHENHYKHAKYHYLGKFRVKKDRP